MPAPEEMSVSMSGSEDVCRSRYANRAEWVRSLKVRDAVVCRLLEAFICFQLKTHPPFQTRFERLKFETDEVVVERLLFGRRADREQFQIDLNTLQAALGLPKSERLALHSAIELALPDWRRGKVQANEERRRGMKSSVKTVLRLFHSRSEEERSAIYAGFGTPRDARTLVRDGVFSDEMLERLAEAKLRLVNDDGSLRPIAFEILEEARYLALRRDSSKSSQASIAA